MSAITEFDKTLTDEIQELLSVYNDTLPSDVMSVINKATKDLIKSGVGDRCLKEGDYIPEFSLPDAYGNFVSSKSLLNKGPLVLSFYRGSWCTFCNLELSALQQRLSDIHELGAELVAITPEKADRSLVLLEKNNIKYPILSDSGNKVSKEFKLTFPVANELRSIYEDVFNLDIPESNGDDSYELPVTATYVVGVDGQIIHAQTSADLTYRMEPAEIIDVLQMHMVTI